MESKPTVYVSQVTNLSDARYCAGMGVDMLGIVVDPDHPDYVSPQKYHEMIGWISGPKPVAQLISLDSSNLKDVIEQYSIDFLHISLEALPITESINIPLLVEVPWEKYEKTARTMDMDKFQIAYLIVSTVPVNTKVNFPAQPPVLVSFGSAPVSYSKILKDCGAKGLMLQGSQELTPGLKDYDHLSTALEQLEGDDLIP